MCISNWVSSVAFWPRLCRMTEDGSVTTYSARGPNPHGSRHCNPTRHHHQEARSGIELTTTQHRYRAKSRLNSSPDVRGHIVDCVCRAACDGGHRAGGPPLAGTSIVAGRHRRPGIARSGRFPYSAGEVSPRTIFEPKPHLLVTNWPNRYPPARRRRIR